MFFVSAVVVVAVVADGGIAGERNREKKRRKKEKYLPNPTLIKGRPFHIKNVDGTFLDLEERLAIFSPKIPHGACGGGEMSFSGYIRIRCPPPLGICTSVAVDVDVSVVILLSSSL